MEAHCAATRTVHVVLPATGRPLCGHEEDGHGPAGAARVPCPECSALLRSGLVMRRAGAGGGRRRSGASE
jgi:hypothetical protein